MARMRTRLGELLASEIPTVVVGDFNVIPEDKDVWSVQAMAADALMQPASRDAYRRILHDGWTDAIDTLNPRGGVWTFWDYQAGAWQRDHGFLSLIHISEPTRLLSISYAVFCLK